jgi:hypothetical protein
MVKLVQASGKYDDEPTAFVTTDEPAIFCKTMSAEAAKVIMQANARTGQANLVFITFSPLSRY